MVYLVKIVGPSGSFRYSWVVVIIILSLAFSLSVNDWTALVDGRLVSRSCVVRLSSGLFLEYWCCCCDGFSFEQLVYAEYVFAFVV